MKIFTYIQGIINKCKGFTSKKKNMSQIILKIETPDDVVYNDGRVCCCLFDASLPEEFLLKARRNFPGLSLLCGKDAAVLCKHLDFDGVVAEADVSKPLKAPLKKIREVIGPRKALGIIIPPRRHEAMLASEVEPEFVAFDFHPEEAGQARDVIKWYNELFLIQSAVVFNPAVRDKDFPETDFLMINSRDYKDFG